MTIKGIGIQGAAALTNALLSFGLLLILARQLGPVTFGDYSVLLNAGVIALVAIEGGYPLLVYRETAAASPTLILWQRRILPLAASSGIVVVLLLSIVPVGTWLGQNLTAWWAVLVCMVAVAWVNIYSGVLRGRGHFAAEAWWQVAARVSSIGTILVALALGAGSVTEIFVAWSLGLLILIGLRKRYHAPIPDFKLVLPVRLAALHLMIGQLLFVAFMRLDLLALAIIGHDATQTANYSVAGRFAEVGFLLFAPVVNVLQLGFRQRLPECMNFANFMRTMTLGAMIFASMLAFIGGMASPLLVTLAFGIEYSQAEPLLVWILSALILMLPSQVLAQATIALNDERTVWIAYAVGLPVTSVAAIMLVPSHGALGMAWSMLIGHGSVFLIFVFSLREYLKLSR